MKVGELLPLKVYPATKMGIAVLTFDFIILARVEFSSSSCFFVRSSCER